MIILMKFYSQKCGYIYIEFKFLIGSKIGMNFAEQWKEISEDIGILLGDIASNGMTQTNSNNMKETENEILQVLSLLPNYFLDFQKKENEDKYMKSDIDSFAKDIDKLKKQAELALTIFSEFQQETSSIKMQNLIYTWDLRDEII